MPLLRRYKRLLGPAVLFAALFLPGYLYQDGSSAAQSLSSLSGLSRNLLFGISQIALLFFIMAIRRAPDSPDYGLSGIRIRDIPLGLAIFAGILVIAAPVAMLGSRSESASPPFIEMISGDPSSLLNGLLLFVFCLVTGYREELFFRAYLISELDASGMRLSVAACISGVIFGLGHLYQGLPGFAGTALIGVFLAFIFLKTRNVHIVAIGHGVYNFAVLFAGSLL
jgi:uncharacterized protein